MGAIPDVEDLSRLDGALLVGKQTAELVKHSDVHTRVSARVIGVVGNAEFASLTLTPVCISILWVTDNAAHGEKHTHPLQRSG